jgi:hypothetical protein
VKFDRVPWSDEAEAGLGSSLGYETVAIKAQVDAGVAILWHSKSANSWLITRTEPDELVIMCYAGRGARAMFRVIYNHAKTLGKRCVRFHTEQPWIIDLLSDWQPMPLEYVVRVAVNKAAVVGAGND